MRTEKEIEADILQSVEGLDALNLELAQARDGIKQVPKGDMLDTYNDKVEWFTTYERFYLSVYTLHGGKTTAILSRPMVAKLHSILGGAL